MKVFRITGTFQMGRVRRQKFVKEVAAEDEARAREVLLSDLGSKHGTPGGESRSLPRRKSPRTASKAAL